MKRFIMYDNNDNVIFEDELQYQQCPAIDNNSGRQCKNICCIPYEFCHTHLPMYMHLQVRRSDIPQAGLGVFAYNETNNNDVVFDNRETICEYIGENISFAELESRYGMYTAPYGYAALKGKLYIDSALKRGVGSLINTHVLSYERYEGDDNKFIKELKQNTNCRFVPHYPEKGKCILNIKATRNIRNGEELILYYGDEYMLDDGSHYKTENIVSSSSSRSKHASSSSSNKVVSHRNDSDDDSIQIEIVSIKPKTITKAIAAPPPRVVIDLVSDDEDSHVKTKSKTTTKTKSKTKGKTLGYIDLT